MFGETHSRHGGWGEWDRRQRKPPGSPRRSPALHQGLGWHVEQPPVNARGGRRGGKATCRPLAATAAGHREALLPVSETRTCEPASALQAPRSLLRLTRPPGRSCATPGDAAAGGPAEFGVLRPPRRLADSLSLPRRRGHGGAASRDTVRETFSHSEATGAS